MVTCVNCSSAIFGVDGTSASSELRNAPGIYTYESGHLLLSEALPNIKCSTVKSEAEQMIKMATEKDDFQYLECLQADFYDIFER